MYRPVKICAFCALVFYLLLSPTIANFFPKETPNRRVYSISNILQDSNYLKLNGYLKEGRIGVIAIYEEEAQISQLHNLVQESNGKIHAHFNQLKMVSLIIPYNTLNSFITMGLQIHLDRKFHACMEVSVPVVKPPAAWGAVETYYGQVINGSGVVVAVLDTGINSHPDLDDLDDNGTTSDPKILFEYDFVHNTSIAVDDNGHGSHVAGIIAGTGEQSGGARVGVAPGCYLLDGKVLDATGQGDETLLLRGILWAIANGSDVINLSLATLESGDGTDPFSQAVEYAVRQGVTVVVAAGNPDPPNEYKVLQPGVCEAAITVGALNRNGIGLFSKSPSGPTHDFRLKPDLLAPGVDIYSCDNDTSGYQQKSGSSQAASHAAGAAALLLQVHPSWTPAQVKDAMMTNAVNLGMVPYTQGGGRLYLPSAVNTSVLANATVDFQLFGTDPLASQEITLTNTRPYPVSVSYVAAKYSVNRSSPFTIPAASSLDITVTVQPSNFSTRRIWEYLNFTVEGKPFHIIAAGFNPALIVSCPPVIRYNTSVTINLTTLLDDHPVDFLANSSVRVAINGTEYGQIPITGNGTITPSFSNASWTRGRYEVTALLFINHTLKDLATGWFNVYGYNSSILMLNYSTIRRWRTDITIPLTTSQNVTGPLRLYIYQEGDWIFIEEITLTQDFEFAPNYVPGTYQCRVVYAGSPIYEPCETTFTLTVTPNHLPLFIILFGLGGVVIVSIFVREQRKERRARQRREKEIKEECVREREQKIMYTSLDRATDRKIRKGEHLEEPPALPAESEKPLGKQDVLGIEGAPPDIANLIVRVRKREATVLYDEAATELAEKTSIEEPEDLIEETEEKNGGGQKNK